MSVYTKLSAVELDDFLSRYRVGNLREFIGITDGIENSNYFVTTDQGRFVLTLFERTSGDGLGYCLNLMAFLSEHAIPSANPVRDKNGNYLQTLKDKPAALVMRLNGASVVAPGLEHCRMIGTTLGAMHTVAQSFSGTRVNERGREWHIVTAARVRDHLPLLEQQLLDAELALLLQFDFDGYPQGVIHADLFRDNVLFDGERLSGLIDFYYAHGGPLIYDLAVTVNDWCFSSHGRFDINRARSMVNAYAAQRAVEAVEIDAWVAYLRVAGLRFWLSRLNDRLFPRGGEITHVKDPNSFKAVLQACHSQAPQLQSVWH